MGFIRSMTYISCEGPYNFSGTVLASLVNIQAIELIKNFLQHTQTDTDIGKMLEITYAWAQYQTDWNTPVLDDVMTALLHAEARWLKYLRNYLKKINTTIGVCKDPSYLLQCYGD
eukprot:15324923-Ditylum_brightwellii.AAC.1